MAQLPWAGKSTFNCSDSLTPSVVTAIIFFLFCHGKGMLLLLNIFAFDFVGETFAFNVVDPNLWK